MPEKCQNIGPRYFRKELPGFYRAGLCLLIFMALHCLVSGAEPAASGAENEDGNFRVIQKRSANGTTTLYAQLTNCSEATITLTMSLANGSTSNDLPLTVDSRGRTSFVLNTVWPTDPARSWSYLFHYQWQPGARGKAAANTFAYHLPYLHGTYTVVQADEGGFSHQKGSRNEHAIDWAMPVGTRVCAARGGTVVAIRQDSDRGGNDLKFQYAHNYVVIKHDDGTFAEYCHLSKNGALVKLGQKVKTGDSLALSGNTGFSSEPHLHFAVYQPIDGQTRVTLPVTFETQTGKTQRLKKGNAY